MLLLGLAAPSLKCAPPPSPELPSPPSLRSPPPPSPVPLPLQFPPRARARARAARAAAAAAGPLLPLGVLGEAVGVEDGRHVQAGEVGVAVEETRVLDVVGGTRGGLDAVWGARGGLANGRTEKDTEIWGSRADSTGGGRGLT